MSFSNVIPPRKILIADDSAIVTRMLSRTLEGAGYHVVTAADGISATQAVYSEWPDLVLLDIYMPRMNGYQVCRLLKHDPDIAAIPVIINTASDLRGAEFWSRHTGADAFMFKGTGSDELLSTVYRLLPHQPLPKPVPASYTPGPEEILSKVSALMDQELYATTARQIELKTILENLCEGILLLDMERRISSANRFFCQLSGVPEAQLVGEQPCAILGEEIGSHLLEMFRDALNGQEPPPRDSEIHHRSGPITPVSINVALVHDYLGETVGCVCLFQDITRRKQVETLNQLKNDLTDMIVHDLRTPLTSLLSGLQTVDVLGDLNTDQREFLNISVEGGQILLGMINDLLDISKMEDGSLRLHYNELSALALSPRILRQVSSLAEAKNISLVLNIAPDLPVFYADEDKISRALVNLLGNAIKFTPDGGTITLVTRLMDDEQAILFAVQDTGEGIPEEAFERIFEKFGQVETHRAGRKMSTGLGLTFCKMVTEAHNGRIWVESTLGQGSTFFFTLPLQAAPAFYQTVVAQH